MRTSLRLSPTLPARDMREPAGAGVSAVRSVAPERVPAVRRAGVPATRADDAVAPPRPEAPAAAAAPRSRFDRAALGLGVLAGLWAVLTGGAVESWVIGAPAVLVAGALIFVFAPAPRWRIAPLGALRFVLWFAAQSVRGAVDVARRALSWHLPIRPGCRTWRTALPAGAPRLVFANAITLLPGTLTAEIDGDRLVLHMLDTRADLDAEVGALEARIAALFALPAPEAPGREGGA